MALPATKDCYQRFSEVVLGPDCVLPVGKLGESGCEEASGVAQVNNLKTVK